MKDINGWVLTDDASSQYVKNHGEGIFSLIEMSICFPNSKQDEYIAYYDTLDINQYFKEPLYSEMVDIISGFGYTIESISDSYGEERDQVIAECIFEHYSSFRATKLLIGSKEECEAAIHNYIRIKG